jgi:spermidine synthase
MQDAAPNPRMLFALALVSAAALAYEILLTRLFSIIQWHHFAYMMISVALLGYGAASAFVTLLQERLTPRMEAAFSLGAALFGVSAVGCFLLAQHVPFNALEFLWDARQPLWLLLVYLLLLVPFFFAAICVCLMFTRYAEQAGRVYGFDIVGAAAGCLGVILALFALTPLGVLAVIASSALAAAVLATPGRGWRPGIAGAGALAAAGLMAWALVGPLGQPRLSPYKALSQTLEVMGARVLAQASGPLGWITVVESRQVPFRHAPGLSLNAPGEPPEQLALFTDGEAMSAMVHFDGRHEALAYLDYLTSALPYHLVERPRVLVLGAGAGADVLQALYAGAQSVQAVELNPQVVRLVEERFAGFSGSPYSQPGVNLHVGEARGFLSASRERFDVIQLALLDSFGASSAGLYALSESYLYTVEALQTALQRLAPGGYVSITRWVTLPPRDTLKLFAMAVQALERNGVSDPSRSLALIRSWKTATLLVKNGALIPQELQRVREFCRERSFDLGWLPGMQAHEADRYNQLDEAYFYDGAVALLGPGRAQFIERYKFNIAPAVDDRPYFFRFFKWATLPELLRLKEQGGLPLLEWGYPLLAATLGQASVLALVLILLPLRLLGVRPAQRAHRPMRARVAAYFVAVGAAFMFVEIAFIQKFVLLLHHPLYAVAVALFGFLLSAGLGGRWSQRLADAAVERRGAVQVAALVIVAATLCYATVLPALLPKVAVLPDAARIALALTLIFPLGFAMGLPFPLGLRRVAAMERTLVPWAWGVNACASVVSAVLATLLAIHIGFTAVLGMAAALYAAAAWMYPAAPHGPKA